MTKILGPKDKRGCELMGGYWWDDECHTEENPVISAEEKYIESLTMEEQDRLATGRSLMEHAGGLYATWTDLAYEEPPEDLLGRIIWSAGVIGQLIVSTFTFPAALGSFLLEESVQSYGMGAYMLSTADAWEELDDYLDYYKAFIEAAEIGVKTLATVNPVTGGAVLIYMQAAKASQRAFRAIAEKGIQKQVESDRALRKKGLQNQNFGDIRIESRPSSAEIWLDSENLEVLTPKTLTKTEAGGHLLTRRHYNTKTENWDI